jgi:hypothetical protein
MPTLADTAYPRLRVSPDEAELSGAFTPTPDELAFAVKGVATRFVQNRTLGENGRYFIGFHKRSFAQDFRDHRFFSKISIAETSSIMPTKGNRHSNGCWRTILNKSCGDPSLHAGRRRSI